MVRKWQNFKGQSIIEYVLVIGVVMVVLIGMQVYMKRGIQGVIKTLADQVGEQKKAEDIDPFKGVKTDSNFTTATRGAPSAIGNLEKGQSMRIRSYEGGGRSTDIYTLSTTSGNATAESKNPKY